MTADDCRTMADECFRWAHDARTVDERRAYLTLACTWLRASADSDDGSVPTLPPAPRLPRVAAIQA